MILINGCKVEDDDKDKPVDKVTYSLNDINGTWNRHSLVTSGNGGFWIYGNIENKDGTSTLNTVLPGAGTWDTTYSSEGTAVSAEGVITWAHDPAAHSYMSSDKRLWVGTTVRGNLYTLVFDLKVVAGTNYSTADFEGTWHSFYLVSGGQWTGWVRAVSVMNNAGKCTSVSQVNSDGDILNTSGGTYALAPDGTITLASNSYHGFMSADKKMFTATMTDGGGGGGLLVSLKEVPGTTFSKADLEGKWAVHTIIAGEENITEHGIISVDGNGNAIFLEMNRDDGSIFNDPGTIAVSITSTGEVTFEEGYHGFMSADKNFFIGLRE
ncbi:MAG TPA: hypothetical protein VK166_14915, partial [Chitinophagaceae bacterium]|nr:hypothetical protein [Chitinophagaceae bacterium]